MSDLNEKKLIIFDMDGTTLYTLEDLHDTVNYALSKNGLPERNMEQVRAAAGYGLRKLVELSMPDDADPQMTDQVFRDLTAWYKVHCNDKTRPYEGIPELMKTLRDNGRKTALVSNKADYAVQILDEKFFPGLLDIGVGEKAGIARKPSADMVNAILKELNIRREDAVYIGDSEVDLKTAENARMDCIAVLWGYRSEAFIRAHGAVHIARTVDELEKMLVG
jgi:phosphoglycolate phosphatase